jgi:hypothetical protein
MDRNAQRGAKIDLSYWSELPARAVLFGEAQARAVVSTNMPDTLISIARKHGVPARTIGQVGELGAPLQITLASTSLTSDLARLDDAYHETIPRIMAQSASGVPVAQQ